MQAQSDYEPDQTWTQIIYESNLESYEDGGDIRISAQLFSNMITVIGWESLDALFGPEEYTITDQDFINELQEILRKAQVELEKSTDANWDQIEWKHVELCQFTIDNGWGISLIY